MFVSTWDYYGFSKAFRMDLETFATKTNKDFKEKTDRRIKGTYMTSAAKRGTQREGLVTRLHEFFNVSVDGR